MTNHEYVKSTTILFLHAFNLDFVTTRLAALRSNVGVGKLATEASILDHDKKSLNFSMKGCRTNAAPSLLLILRELFGRYITGL